MPMKQDFHVVRLQGPYFGQAPGASLHRYFEAEFIQRFQRDLQRHLLQTPAAQQWREEDRFSEHDDKLVLRLPMHKCFYLVCCEIVCDRLGTPALDPQKVASAGFVIRRLTAAGEQSWMLEEDQALGWEATSTGLRDPDVHRRLCRDGTLHPRDPVATYSGEQTHPLHALKIEDENGKCHTLLFGYVPLGGSYMLRQESRALPFDAASLQEFTAAAAEQLPWPYGLRKPLQKIWRLEYARPIAEGTPSREFFELLRLLLNRYHLGEAGIDENQALQELTEGIYFYDQGSAPADLKPENFTDYSRGDFRRWRKYSLWSWLQRHFSGQENRLLQWLVRQEDKIDKAGGLENVAFDKLPPGSGTGDLRYSLYLTAGDARDFRTLLDQRVLDQALNTAKEIPLPKFQQGGDDVYQIVPFARVLEDNGRQRIHWADEDTRSEKFRVAAPFAPEASRPSLIQMPSLGDLRKGLARGVSMITPPDTFNLLNALNLKKGASEDVLPEGEPGGIGIQWICSFSLPVITLVAMILLMIMISLLNIVFFWLPWIKICLPFPKIK